MNTFAIQIRSGIHVVIAATVAFTNLARAHGDHIHPPTHTAVSSHETFYTNRGYSQGIHGYPNVQPDLTTTDRATIYVDQAYGPAIYSYPSSHAMGTLPAARMPLPKR